MEYKCFTEETVRCLLTGYGPTCCWGVIYVYNKTTSKIYISTLSKNLISGFQNLPDPKYHSRIFKSNLNFFFFLNGKWAHVKDSIQLSKETDNLVRLVQRRIWKIDFSGQACWNFCE